MKKIVFLMPVYNDWASFTKLLDEINLVIEDIKEFRFDCIAINDFSTTKLPRMTKPNNIDSLKIINMKENRGHARCIASGLRFINAQKNYDYAIILDSDGEDRPIEIKDLISLIKQEPEKTIVASRVKRSEGIIFQTLYKIHKLITLFFTGRKINFGNYCCLTKNDINLLSNKSSLWCSFSGSIKKHILNYNEIKSERGVRFFGPSKMSLINLIIHSFAIISVFKNVVFFRSTIMIILLLFLNKFNGQILIMIQMLLVLFNIIIFVVSFRDDESALLKSHENILNVETITQ
tara:strand:- start:2718 stop:3590 length:873 start_codon:yes stop_codon:yes gene_type:complete